MDIGREEERWQEVKKDKRHRDGDLVVERKERGRGKEG